MNISTLTLDVCNVWAYAKSEKELQVIIEDVEIEGIVGQILATRTAKDILECLKINDIIDYVINEGYCISAGE